MKHDGALLDLDLYWFCPNCTEVTITKPIDVPVGGGGSPFHTCRGLKGLTAPFVLAGTDCKVEAVEREDYVAGEDVTYDGDGRPIMAVVTTRADGSNDVAAFAPTAHAGRDQ